VPRAEFERFRATYATLFEIAKERGVHHMKLKKELTERRVDPAIDPATTLATFYRREDVKIIDSATH
jgi:transcription termination factor Rho